MTGASGGDLLDDDGLLDLRGRARATDPAAVIAEERRRRSAPSAKPMADVPPPAGTPPGAAHTCALCGGKARDRCTMCGRPACAADLWVMLRLCRACADERAVARGQRGAQPEAANWLERR